MSIDSTKLKNRGYRAALLGVLILVIINSLGFGLIIKDYFNSANNIKSAQTTNVDSTQVTSANQVGGVSLQTNTLDNYLVYKKQLVNLVTTQDPKVALNSLASLMKTTQFVDDNCHILAHEIGHAAFARYGDFSKSVSYQTDVCGSGYIHGLVEVYFKSITNPGTVMLSLCTPNGGTCKHAVGHGLMYFTNNDIPSALKLCNNYTDLNSKRWCGEGVFMENFETNTDFHSAKYLKPDQPFYPCSNQVGIYKYDCYYYSGRYLVRLNNSNYSAALTECTMIPENSYLLTCVRGVGSVIMRENILDPKQVEKYCATAPKDTVNSCIAGALSYYIVIENSSYNALKNVCAKFVQPALKLDCLKNV